MRRWLPTSTLSSERMIHEYPKPHVEHQLYLNSWSTFSQLDLSKILIELQQLATYSDLEVYKTFSSGLADQHEHLWGFKHDPRKAQLLAMSSRRSGGNSLRCKSGGWYGAAGTVRTDRRSKSSKIWLLCWVVFGPRDLYLVSLTKSALYGPLVCLTILKILASPAGKNRKFGQSTVATHGARTWERPRSSCSNAYLVVLVWADNI